MEWQKVESSNVAAFGYKAEERELHIRFNSGAEYVYFDVPANVVQAFMEADSKGRYLNENIKGVYEFVKA